jgi:hypothetical protein
MSFAEELPAHVFACAVEYLEKPRDTYLSSLRQDHRQMSEHGEHDPRAGTHPNVRAGGILAAATNRSANISIRARRVANSSRSIMACPSAGATVERA